MKVPTQNSAQDKRHKPVGWANVVFAHAERACALVLLCSFALILAGGCGQPEPPNVKKARAIAAENIELKKELAKSNKELEILKADYSKEIKAQKKMLQTCLQEKEQLKEKSRQNVRDQVKNVLDTVLDENAKLRAENSRLKAQIEQLQKQTQ
jgi:GTPase involved in cell partitioning and DNA repair